MEPKEIALTVTLSVAVAAFVSLIFVYVVPSTTGYTISAFSKNYNSTNSTNFCNDTDGGLNFFVKGTVIGLYNGVPYSYTDYCQSENILMEYFCSGSSWNVMSQSCQLGYVCSNGTCIQQQNNQTNQSMPDLIIQDFKPFLSGKAGNGSCLLRVNTTVKNIGNAFAPYTYTYVGANYVGYNEYTIPLLPQQSTTISSLLVVAPGVYNLMAYADATAKVAELNEANNDYLMNYSVPASCTQGNYSIIISHGFAQSF